MKLTIKRYLYNDFSRYNGSTSDYPAIKKNNYYANYNFSSDIAVKVDTPSTCSKICYGTLNRCLPEELGIIIPSFHGAKRNAIRKYFV